MKGAVGNVQVQIHAKRVSIERHTGIGVAHNQVRSEFVKFHYFLL